MSERRGVTWKHVFWVVAALALVFVLTPYLVVLFG